MKNHNKDVGTSVKQNHKTNLSWPETKKGDLPAPRIPYGYRIRAGRAVIEPEEAGKVLSLYQYYVKGASVRAAMEAAGISFGLCKGRKILQNSIYTGDEFYPPIIDQTLFDQASRTAEERRAQHGVKKGIPLARAQQPVPPHTTFIWKEAASLNGKRKEITGFEELQAQAADLYARIDFPKA